MGEGEKGTGEKEKLIEGEGWERREAKGRREDKCIH